MSKKETNLKFSSNAFVLRKLFTIISRDGVCAICNRLEQVDHCSANQIGLTPPAELDGCQCIIKLWQGKSPLYYIALCPKGFDDIQVSWSGWGTPEKEGMRKEQYMHSANLNTNDFKGICALIVALALALTSAASDSLAASDAAASNLPTLGVVQQWSLSAPHAGYLDQFGYAVAIDGNTAVIGARNADPDLGGGSIQNAGAVYVYTYNGKTWLLEGALTAKDAQAGDTFGVAVAISGSTIVVGATGVALEDPNNKNQEVEGAGAAYIFTRSGGSWVQQAKLTAADFAEDDTFGSAVAIYQNTAVVAASTKNLPPLENVGAVYVFQNGGGKEWNQRAKLLPSDPFLGDYFGSSVAIYGNRIAIGAIQTNPIGENGPGKVYIFKRDGQVWRAETLLKANSGRSGDSFGSSIGLYNDTMVVGAQHADPDLGAGRVTNAGAAYVFQRTGSDWKESATLNAVDGQVFDQFGRSVDIYNNVIVVGADGATQAGNTRSGAVYVFQKDKGGWSQQTRAVTDPTSEGDLFGRSVAISRDWFAAGASGRNPGAITGAGEAFLNRLGTVQLPSTGFVPEVRTSLPAQPAHLAYQDYGAMSLEIPSLRQTMAIVGVPKSGDGWDVRWLGKQAGYLEGTAFPTWQGNTGLAGHSTLADGSPGPFANLGSLRWGDEVIIRAWGQRYIYAVHQNSLVAPRQLAALKHEDMDWVTLITCQGYDETSGKYLWRRVVRAVLVAIVD
jgi:LPXTG-site transpeptidase (sortase) family protein